MTIFQLAASNILLVAPVLEASGARSSGASSTVANSTGARSSGACSTSSSRTGARRKVNPKQVWPIAADWRA